MTEPPLAARRLRLAIKPECQAVSLRGRASHLVHVVPVERNALVPQRRQIGRPGLAVEAVPAGRGRAVGRGQEGEVKGGTGTERVSEP